MSSIPWLEPDRHFFPPVSLALDDPPGLLAAGGDLSPARLLTAYRQGIFPWYEEPQPILWWSPDPRMVLRPDALHISRSLRKSLNKRPYQITFDQRFEEVIRQCGETRAEQEGTWITEEMIDAYCHLHELGHAHSVEAWQDGELVGGLYGIAIGQAFFGESMFSLRPNSSKIAFVHLVKQLEAWDFQLIDCQVETAYLASFGAELMPRGQFVSALKYYTEQATQQPSWQLEWAWPNGAGSEPS